MIDKYLLKSYMSKKRKTSKDMAEKLNINVSTFYLKMNGHRDFTRNELSIILKTLELSTEEVGNIFFAN
ncbi:helix-turn-helix domain-containing protein [Peptostreptococcus faecalis]|uniref:helix-turn-helix domain-containing protein n=1 Tax=Peptostreptococcus faecalis TaxID=2045015 RepID=UPI000C7E7BB2|nr:helix-turn-helix transcriptional regulator [Peptostreptococcus faecalis]